MMFLDAWDDWSARLFRWVSRWSPFKKSAPSLKRRTRRKIEREWSLGNLLGQLDKEHERWALKFDKHSFTGKGDWRALRALGPHILPSECRFVPDMTHKDLFKIPSEWKDKPLPVLMYVGWRECNVGYWEKDPGTVGKDGVMTATWAMRINKSTPSWRVEKTPGVTYLAGCVLEGEGKEMVLCFYITLDLKKMEIHVPKILTDQIVRLPSKRVAGRREGGDVYCRRSWEGVNEAYGVDAYDLKPDRFENPEDCATRMVVMEFSACMNAWNLREDLYQISTRKGKSRVTFCVAKGEQKFFFKDRDKTAVARDGKRKRIVHYVGAFTRTNGQQVKEHLRGIRQFRWRDYNISIMVPKFHLATHGFDVASVDEEEMVLGERYLDLKEAMRKLANDEENATYSHGRQ